MRLPFARPLLFLALALAISCATKRVSEPERASTEGARAEAAAGVEPAVRGDRDLSHLSESARAELATVLSDEFCYCGCPHTLGACLEAHTACSHAPRMLRLAVAESQAGKPAAETIVSLQRYYAGFPGKRAKFEVDRRQCVGSEAASVEVVEFSDFECPYCAAARPMFEAWAAENAERVRFCVVPYPLPMHPNALPASQAVLFARDHGKFWPLHDRLFEHAHELSLSRIVALGGEVGLDTRALEKALRDGVYVEELERMKTAARAAELSATPSVYFNGRKLTLPLGPSVLSHSLDDELEWNAHNGAWQAD